MLIVKVPGINGLGKTNGCERAGDAIINALHDIHMNEQGKEIDVKKLDLEEIHLDNKNLELSNKLIYKNAFECFEDYPKVIFLGGDHSISYSLTRAFLDYCETNNKTPCLIVFDAHADLMPSMSEPTHEEWLRRLIEEGFPTENILLIGSRNFHKTEKKFIEENKIKVISMSSLLEDLQGVADSITEFANKKELYVSIDIDVVDPSMAPSTGYIEPGGLSVRQFLYILQRINKIKSLHGLDIVEINEMKDKEKDLMTIKLGAKIVAEVV